MRKYKFRFKLLLTNVCVIGAVITVFLVSFLWYYLDIRSDQNAEEMERTIQKVSSGMETSIEMLDSIALQLSTNNYIVGVLKDLDVQNPDNYFQSEVVETKRIHEFMWSYILKTDVASRVCIYNRYGDFVYTGNAVDNEKVVEYIRRDHIDSIEQELAQDGIYSLYENCQEDRLTLKSNPGYVSVIRAIQEDPMLRGTPLGYVEVQLSITVLGRMLNTGVDTEYFCVKDLKSKEFLFGSDSEIPESVKDKAIIRRAVPIEKYGIQIEMEQDNSGQAVFMRNMMLTILAVLIVLTGGVFIIQKSILTRLTSPLIKLCESVTRIEGGGAEQGLVLEGGYDEFAHIETAFNQMLGNLRQSMEEVVLARTSELNAQLLALQAQMDPHFIHNAIAVIGALADEGENEKAVLMCQKLSEMIRYNTEYGDARVQVQEEIRHAENYLDLMKVRYEDKFQYQISSGIDWRIQIPKYVLQPLVENCFRHGFKKKGFPWQLEIRCYEDERNWYLEVRDNGVGMDQEQMEEISRQLSLIQTKNPKEMMENLKIGGLSLINVMMRLWMNYGNTMFFEIKMPGIGNEGAVVCIGGLKND
ncbi:sensor histidine kinase [Diplocloster modestus]|uniref:Histidine kinase n=1 Tax=Diplocloster modestus TaxID=2850322 RepID=A0ABS6KEZ9_9FIRM|nr:histidine kinase [Diplocloster modestus]MBU9729106.1 histidine kinase [Diplocloster modestus]